MTEELGQVDPEVEELLLAISKDRRGGLLRVPASELRAHLYGRAPRADSRDRLLSSAERELVKRHRMQVALLLRRAALLGVLDDPKERTHCNAPVGRSARIPDPVDLARDADRARITRPNHAGTGDALSILCECVGGHANLRDNVTRFSLASLRMMPSDEGRIYLAVDLRERGEYQSSHRLLRSVLGGGPTDAVASFAWENIGCLHGDKGEDAAAARGYARAADLGEPRLEPLMSGMRFALRAGDRERALWAGRRIDRLCGPEHPSIEWWSKCQETHRRAQGDNWRPHAVLRGLINDLEPELGHVARTVASAMR